MLNIALVGNQNSGKTSLFNLLTGANQHVGNFPGVTVEQKTGKMRKFPDVTLIDLPGIYSLTPYSNDEAVTRDFLVNQKPNAILNIVDVTNIERSLYLSVQLIGLGIPIVLALNMMDELQNNGGSVNVTEIEENLGIPVVPISAFRNEGIKDLTSVLVKTARTRRFPLKLDYCAGPVHRAIHGISHLIEDHAQNMDIPPRLAAVKLIEGDPFFEERLKLSQNEKDMIEHSIQEMECEIQTDRAAALADSRYSYIERLVSAYVIKPGISIEKKRSNRIDALLTHKYWGIPFFFAIILLIFGLTFGTLGRAFSELFVSAIHLMAQQSATWMASAGINPIVQDLVINGVFNGVGSVLSFLPIIVLLFFFLSILEDSGYMSRVAFLMDKPLRKIGLSGKSFVPMLIGFGCSVPAILAARTLSSEKDRRLTIVLIPFMSCSAKLPIYAVFSAAFFPLYAAWVMMALYVSGILIGILCALFLKQTVFRGNSMPFIMEMPNYRMPSAKSIALLVWEKARDFLQRAFTIIFVASLVIWFLQTFDFQINVAVDMSHSILAVFGEKIAPVFRPLGFGDWRAVTALISGFSAKEAVVGSLAVLSGTGIENLSAGLAQLFTPLSAASFLMFTLLYTPCIATVATLKRELGSGGAFLVVIFQIIIAWCVAFGVFQIGSWMAF